MLEIKTKSGFECSVSENTLKDWRVVRALSKAYKAKDDATSVDAMSDIIAILLREREEEFYQHLMDEDGLVMADKVLECAGEILDAIGNHQKNS